MNGFFFVGLDRSPLKGLAISRWIGLLIMNATVVAAATAATFLIVKFPVVVFMSEST